MRHSMFAVSLLAAALSLAACKPASFTAPQGDASDPEATAAAQSKPAAESAAPAFATSPCGAVNEAGLQAASDSAAASRETANIEWRMAVQSGRVSRRV